MRLHQLKLEFNPEQDRLVLHVLTDDGAEILLWLTRRCVKLLWMALVKMLQASPSVQVQGATAEARDALVGMQHEKALQGANFSKPYEQARDRPLGAEPILVGKIQTGRDPNGNNVLTLLPMNGQGVNIALDETLLHSFCKLLQNAVVRAEWDMKLELPQSSRASVPVEGARTLN